LRTEIYALLINFSQHLLKKKKVCATEATHTEKCIASNCYHTKFSTLHRRCENRSLHFYQR